MKKVVKKGLRSGLQASKKLANSNKYSKKMAQKLKKATLAAIGTGGAQEVYNVSSFYPSIQDYYYQTKDFNEKKDPLISILLPTYNTPENYLRECIESIIVQSYFKWELCIADDNSPDKNVIKIIKEYQKKDKRIKLVERKTNGHISEATNSALKIATGEFVALMDHDDVLWPNALYEMVAVIRVNKKVDFIYTDEDKLDGTGKVHSYPFLKPDFSPEFLESCNYITHFSCIRTKVMKDVGGFRKGYEGAQDWDLFIRIAEVTQNIVHIPKILYSWRVHEASTASDTDAKPYVYEAQKKLLADHAERLNKEYKIGLGAIETGIIPQHRTIKYPIKTDDTLSVVLFHSDIERTRRFIRSLAATAAGAPYEILCVHDKTISPTIEGELRELNPQVSLRFLRVKDKKQTNTYLSAAKKAKGNYLLFANDNLEIISESWAKIFMGDAQLKHTGFVGPVLLNTDKATIMSAGLGLGYGEHGYLDMLQGMPFNDPHYTRGLYAKSRRNVSSVSSALFAIEKKRFLSFIEQGSSQFNIISTSLSMLEKEYRHIYTPYIQAVVHGRLPRIESNKLITEDRYLNPNFNHTNQNMEVRA